MDICFKENLFKMLKRKGKRGAFKKDIPTNNKYKYSGTVIPILETEGISEEGIANLPCHTSQPLTCKIKEDDALHYIYAKRINQKIGFMYEWLKLLVLMHRKHFTIKASDYLDSKGLNIKLWAEGIRDG